MPLGRRPGLMCEYTSNLDDPQRHVNYQMTDEEVTEGVKKIMHESESVCRQIGLSPFYTQNKPPTVSTVLPFYL